MIESWTLLFLLSRNFLVVPITGFVRIGKLVLPIAMSRDDIEVIAVNDHLSMLNTWEASECSLKGIWGYSEEDVSNDFIDEARSSIFDANGGRSKSFFHEACVLVLQRVRLEKLSIGSCTWLLPALKIAQNKAILMDYIYTLFFHVKGGLCALDCTSTF